MNRQLLSTCLTPAMLIFAAPAQAQTTVSTAITTPLVTSSAGDVTVASGGTITVNGGAAITADSSKSVTVATGGTLTQGAANSSTGITVNAGTTSTISNAGTINVKETFTPSNDGNGAVSGPIAQAAGRYGILVAGPATGSITNSGTIAIDGENSGGIVTNGTYQGNIANTGTIAVIGDNSVGIGTQGVNGNLTVGGTITVTGAGAQAVLVNGDISGAFKLNGSVGQASSLTTDSNTTLAMPASSLKNGAAAVQISGSVAGGVDIYAPPVGNTDTTLTTGFITAYGSSPALLVGGANPISIGTVAGRDGTYSLAIDGSVTANSVKAGIDSFGVVIGGQGGTVSMLGGIGVSGTLSATTSERTAAALLINTGSTVPSLYISGAITATQTQTGLGGSTYGVRDLSGTLTSITNTGAISANGSTSDTARAIDVSANTTGVTITQQLNATDAAAQVTERAAAGYNPATAVVYTSIRGDIVTGSGNDTLDIQSGTVTGNAFLGTGNNSVKLSNDARFTGGIDFGGGGTATMTMAGTSTYTSTSVGSTNAGAFNLEGQVGTLTLSDSAVFAGNLLNANQLSVTVNGGTFGSNVVGDQRFNALTVGANGKLSVYVANQQATHYIVNTASFASGSKITANLASLTGVEGSYTILTTGTLTGTTSFDTTAVLPVLFKGTVSVGTNAITLNISRKTATDLGLTRTQSQGYDAIYNNALFSGTGNAAIATSLLQAADVPTLQKQFEQMLPDHSGGVFDIVTRGSRLAARHLADADSIYSISDAGGWIEPIYFNGSKRDGGSIGYKTDGFGLTAGGEWTTGIGRVGVMLSYIDGSDKTGDWQKVKVSDIELGLFWRRASGPLYTFAKVSGGILSMSSTRNLTGTINSVNFTDTASGKWKGYVVSGMAGISYKAELGNFTLKPMATLDYFRVHEGAYTETGNDAIDLAVGARNSDSFSALTTLTLGWSAGKVTKEYRPLTLEVEAGPRTQLGGTLGNTTAAFSASAGNPFTLTPDELKSGWMAEARILQGGMDYTWKLAAGADKLQGGTDLSIRASFSLAL